VEATVSPAHRWRGRAPARATRDSSVCSPWWARPRGRTASPPRSSRRLRS